MTRCSRRSARRSLLLLALVLHIIALLSLQALGQEDDGEEPSRVDGAGIPLVQALLPQLMFAYSTNKGKSVSNMTFSVVPPTKAHSGFFDLHTLEYVIDSDRPDLTDAADNDVLSMPIAAFALGIFVNIPGANTTLVLSRDLLPLIFLGEIQVGQPNNFLLCGI